MVVSKTLPKYFRYSFKSVGEILPTVLKMVTCSTRDTWRRDGATVWASDLGPRSRGTVLFPVGGAAT